MNALRMGANAARHQDEGRGRRDGPRSAEEASRQLNPNRVREGRGRPKSEFESVLRTQLDGLLVGGADAACLRKSSAATCASTSARG